MSISPSTTVMSSHTSRISPLSLNCLRQWPAVRRCLLEMRVPPHRSVSLVSEDLRSSRAAQGNSLTSASSPPTEVSSSSLLFEIFEILRRLLQMYITFAKFFFWPHRHSQGLLLHSLVFDSSPRQSLPPFAGLGLSQDRSRSFFPVPQVLVHDDQGDHLDQRPSTIPNIFDN